MRNPSSGTKTPCCSKVGIKKGPWTPEEDEVLSNYIKREGEGRWRTLPKRAGLQRCGKSCRLRWMNYLRPSVKRGRIAPDEEDLILRLHRLLGNRWSLIAGRIPGRTDNEIKNYWNTHLSKKLISQGIDPRTHKPLNPVPDSSETGHDHLASSSNPNPNPSCMQTEETGGSNQATAAKSIENFTTNPHHYQTHVANDDMTPIENFIMGLPSNVHADINQQENYYIDQNCNDQDTFSSFLDSLINDNVLVNQQPHNIISPSLHPIVSSAQTFSNTPHHDNMIWEAEVVATTMVGLDNEHQQGSLNNHLA